MDKLTNEKKYKTAEERINAFNAWCLRTTCDKCDKPKNMNCGIYWLHLEAEEEKPEPCPFCNEDTEGHFVGGFCVACECGYNSAFCETEAEAIAEHNRVARAVRAAEKGEASGESEVRGE